MSLRVDHSSQNHTIGLDEPKTAVRKGTDFGKVLAQTHKLQDQELEIFLRRLESQGEKLAKSHALQDLIEFKNMVKDFLKTTLGKSRILQEETFWDFSGQPRAMSRVTKINRALEELGEQVLSSQAESLTILAKINEIKGLIIDLLA